MLSSDNFQPNFVHIGIPIGKSRYNEVRALPESYYFKYTKAELYPWFPLGLGKWESIFQSGKGQGILPKILEKSEKIILEN